MQVTSKSDMTMPGKSLSFCALMVGLCGPIDAVAALTPTGETELNFMLGYIIVSKCDFYRNGTWYNSERAEAHLRSKYGYLKSSINHPEEFIEKAATKSSFTGEPYQVRCGSDAAMPSARWLTQTLTNFRARPLKH